MDLHPPALHWWPPILSLLSSVIRTCFWLVVVCKFIDRRPPKVTVYFYLKFFALNSLPPTIGHHPPTCSNPRVPPLQHPFYRGRQLLVDCCVLPINGGHLSPQCVLNSKFFCAEFVASNDWAPPFHTFQPPCASSQTSFLLRPPTPSWLLCVAIKRRPRKADAPFSSLFFDVVYFGVPNGNQPAWQAITKHLAPALDP